MEGMATSKANENLAFYVKLEDKIFFFSFDRNEYDLAHTVCLERDMAAATFP